MFSECWTHKHLFPKNDFSPCILGKEAPSPRKFTYITRGLQVAICPPLSKGMTGTRSVLRKLKKLFHPRNVEQWNDDLSAQLLLLYGLAYREQA
jgi:hypothetical protein